MYQPGSVTAVIAGVILLPVKNYGRRDYRRVRLGTVGAEGLKGIVYWVDDFPRLKQVTL